MKTCTVCEGINDTRYGKCRECYNEYMREYMQVRWERRRARGIELLGGKCIECASTETLEFDHLNRETKSFTLAKQTSCSEARFLTELAKCVLRCSQCHIRRTAQQLWNEHGEGKTGRDGCTCEPCKTRKREYMKARAPQYNEARRQRRAAQRKTS